MKCHDRNVIQPSQALREMSSNAITASRGLTCLILIIATMFVENTCFERNEDYLHSADFEYKMNAGRFQICDSVIDESICRPNAVCCVAFIHEHLAFINMCGETQNAKTVLMRIEFVNFSIFHQFLLVSLQTCHDYLHTARDRPPKTKAVCSYNSTGRLASYNCQTIAATILSYPSRSPEPYPVLQSSRGCSLERF